MSDGIDHDQLWDLVRELIDRKGRRKLSVEVLTDSMAGSGGWTVREWEGQWFVMDPADEWHGPLDADFDGLAAFEIFSIDSTGRWSLRGPLARQALHELTLLSKPEDDEPVEVMVNDVLYQAVLDGERVVKWRRIRE